MSKIGIFFGSSNGTTEAIAEQLGEKLNVAAADIHNVGSASADELNQYDVLLLGTSTWGAGDLQDDWFDFLDSIKTLDLAGKKVALFGCGDSSTFSDTFCDAMGTIYQELQPTGCTFIGAVETEGYTFDESTAVVDGKFVGLALDEMNEDDMTADRINNWVEALAPQL